MTGEVTIVGAGIVGVASALWLQRAGCRVTLIDSGAVGEGASFGNAGNLSPGSVVPHLIPGFLKELPGWLLKSEGPLTIRPRYALKALPWLAAAAKASRAEEALKTSRAMHALHGDTLNAYAMLTAGPEAESLIERSGQLYVSEHPDGAKGSALAQRMRAEAGVKTVVLDWMEIRELEPALAPIFKSGVLFPDNARCKNPHELVKALAAKAQQQGATILRGEVIAFQTQGRTVQGIVVDGSVRSVDRLVIAAGARSRALAAKLGSALPLEAERGYHITISEPRVVPRIPVMHCDAKFVAAPMNMGLRLAGTAEFAGLEAPPNWQRTQVLKRQAARMFPGVRLDSVSRWTGDRPSFPDGLPVLGRAPHFDNAYFAFGNSHFGMTAGPVMGKLIAELITAKQSSIDIAPFRAERFTS
jgi:D-amino-acid dehydrogenase